MSTQQIKQVDKAAELLDETIIAQYLADNPSFFVRNSYLITRLQIPHHSGAAVSLVERQVAMLREKNARLEKRLNDLVTVARENERLGTQVHDFTLKLVKHSSLDALIALTCDTLVQNFGAEAASIHLIDDASSRLSQMDAVLPAFTHDDSQLACFEDLIRNRSAMCGRLSQQQREILFKEDADKANSCALVTLSGERVFGLLALRSSDENHFHPGKGVFFLKQLSDLVSARMAEYVD